MAEIKYEIRVVSREEAERKLDANESKRIVTDACKTPPNGTPQRAWQNALMALEEHARTRGWSVQPTDVEIMREVIAAYERAR